MVHMPSDHEEVRVCDSGVASYPHLIQEDSDSMRQILILALVFSGRSEHAKAH